MKPSFAEPISKRTYWVGTAVLVFVYLSVWIIHFHDVYGWIMDDRYVFLKGSDTVHSFASAFSGYNALQPYFFLVSYLPLRSGWSLPSAPLPEFGVRTGQFRFFLLYAVFLHGIVVVVWAWFAERLAGNRPVAFLSTLLLITSPSFVLWTPQPDSRVLGLPFAFCGLALMFHPGSARRFFVAGSLLTLAQAIHYTALVLILPVCAVFWIRELWKGELQWRRAFAFLAGVLWLPVLLELASLLLLRIPLENGPVMTLIHLFRGHSSAWNWAGNLRMWIQWFHDQAGYAMIAAAAIGCVTFRTRTPESKSFGETGRAVIAWAIPLAILFICLVSRAQPMFRQTTPLQPFLFLFSASAIVSASRWIFHDVRWRILCAVILTAAAGMVGWREAVQVFQAHLGLGRAVNWAAAHHGSHNIYWLPIHWFPDNAGLTTLDELGSVPPGSWLITYAPWSFFTDRPSLRAYFESTEPLVNFPTLYSTDSLRAELKARGYNDFRTDPLMAEARVLEISKVLDAMRGTPLEIASVSADSVSSAASEPANVFDRDGSPDNNLEWISAPTPMPHFLEMRFAHPVRLGEMHVVLPPTDRSTSRISDMEIRVAGEQGPYRVVWSGTTLEKYPVIRARWEPLSFSRLRCVIYGQKEPIGPTPQATIEEIVFPGYTVAAPLPGREFAPLIFTRVEFQPDRILVSGRNVTASTVLVVGEQKLRLFPSQPETFEARLSGNRPLPPCGPAHLEDSFRRSNQLTCNENPKISGDR